MWEGRGSKIKGVHGQHWLYSKVEAGLHETLSQKKTLLGDGGWKNGQVLAL